MIDEWSHSIQIYLIQSTHSVNRVQCQILRTKPSFWNIIWRELKAGVGKQQSQSIRKLIFTIQSQSNLFQNFGNQSKWQSLVLQQSETILKKKKQSCTIFSFIFPSNFLQISVTFSAFFHRSHIFVWSCSPFLLNLLQDAWSADTEARIRKLRKDDRDKLLLRHKIED